MKRLLLLLVVAMLILVTATPVLATGKQSKFTLVGEITALDPVTQTITVKVLQGNNVIRPYQGKTIVLNLNAKTRLLSNDGITTSVIKFADLKVDNKISALGILDTTWLATRITLDLKACPK